MSPAMREIAADIEHDGACQCQACRHERHFGIDATDEAPEPIGVECCDDYYCDDEDDR